MENQITNLDEHDRKRLKEYVDINRKIAENFLSDLACPEYIHSEGNPTKNDSYHHVYRYVDVRWKERINPFTSITNIPILQRDIDEQYIVDRCDHT